MTSDSYYVQIQLFCLLNIDNNVIQWAGHITISLSDGATGNGVGVLGIFMHPLADCVRSNTLHRISNKNLSMKCVIKNKKNLAGIFEPDACSLCINIIVIYTLWILVINDNRL